MLRLKNIDLKLISTFNDENESRPNEEFTHFKEEITNLKKILNDIKTKIEQSDQSKSTAIRDRPSQN